MPERPLLTAHWRNLLLVNFDVPPNVIERIAPPGTEPDLHDGRCYISIVGFLFQRTRLFGLPFPGHTNFLEINLRYYVRRSVGDEIRRGVVFAHEIASRRAVSLIANRVYHENYVTRPMRSDTRMTCNELTPGDTIEYAWKTRVPLPCREGLGEGSFGRSPAHRWNRLAAQVAAPLAFPPRNSREEYFVEHYWGYVRGRDGLTREYSVVHNPWRVAPADNIIWDCDIAASFNNPLAEYLASPPTSALIAEGSPIQLYRGRKL